MLSSKPSAFPEVSGKRVLFYLTVQTLNQSLSGITAYRKPQKVALSFDSVILFQII